MKRFAALQHAGRSGAAPLLDPCRYVRAADRAIACGDHDEACGLIAQAYLAFDLCAAGCLQARAWDRELSERNS